MVGMPESIRKVFAVGEQTFETYAEAQRYASANRIALQRLKLIEFLERNTGNSGGIVDWTPLADALLSAYEIKPRKTRND